MEETDFYKRIEPGIKDIVRYLRDNGINTYNSCGHEMTVDIELSSLSEVEYIANLLVEKDYKFVIDVRLDRMYDGYWQRTCRIKFHTGVAGVQG